MKEATDRGLEKSLEKGLEKGIEQGQLKAKLEVAKNMIRKNICIDDIIELTGLTKNQVLKIKDSKLQ